MASGTTEEVLGSVYSKEVAGGEWDMVDVIAPVPGPGPVSGPALDKWEEPEQDEETRQRRLREQVTALHGPRELVRAGAPVSHRSTSPDGGRYCVRTQEEQFQSWLSSNDIMRILEPSPAKACQRTQNVCRSTPMDADGHWHAAR